MNQVISFQQPSSLVRAGVAQLVEHQPSKLRVASSSLVSRSSFLSEKLTWVLKADVCWMMDAAQGRALLDNSASVAQW
jgi:hypothetical protein